MKDRKLDAILACRVEGTRLYGKPLQYIDIERRVTILEHLVRYIRTLESVSDICLAISSEKPNVAFAELAEKHDWKYTFGHPHDVLGRVLAAARAIGSTDVLRITSECPFMVTAGADALFREHAEGGYDFAEFKRLPEGAGFEIISVEALARSWDLGGERYRAEAVSRFIFENQTMFKLLIKEPPKPLQRPEVRITVDYPEDLTFCRRVYHDLRGHERLIPLEEIIAYWDSHPEVRKEVEAIGIDWGRGRLWE